MHVAITISYRSTVLISVLTQESCNRSKEVGGSHAAFCFNYFVIIGWLVINMVDNSLLQVVVVVF